MVFHISFSMLLFQMRTQVEWCASWMWYLFRDILVLFLALLLVKGLQNALGLSFFWKRRKQSGQSDLGIYILFPTVSSQKWVASMEHPDPDSCPCISSFAGKFYHIARRVLCVGWRGSKWAAYRPIFSAWHVCVFSLELKSTLLLCVLSRPMRGQTLNLTTMKWELRMAIDKLYI